MDAQPRFWVLVSVNGRLVFDNDRDELFATFSGLQLTDVIGVSVRRGGDDTPMTYALGVPGDYIRGEWELACEIVAGLNNQPAVA